MQRRDRTSLDGGARSENDLGQTTMHTFTSSRSLYAGSVTANVLTNARSSATVLPRSWLTISLGLGLVGCWLALLYGY
jgi:hypothetical protein